MKGRFIALEGGEGAGKTTAIALICDLAARTGREVVRTREPGGTPNAEALRNLMLTEDSDYSPEAQLLMMQAARAEHVRTLIRPALERGAIVVTDRYVLTTLTHQGGGYGLSADLIHMIHRHTTGNLMPDLTIALDVPASIGLARSMKRQGGKGEVKYELLGEAFHERARAAMFRHLPEKSIVIDATQPIESVTAEISARMTEWLAVEIND